MLGLKLNHVSKRGHSHQNFEAKESDILIEIQNISFPKTFENVF